MVFIKVLGTGCLVVEATTVSQVEESVRDLWPSTDFILTLNGRRVDENSVLGSDAVLTAAPRLPGGKGGFGSMLRALGAQIEKTTNKEACRDLSGRRLRDINEEDRLKKYVAKRAEREREAQEKKEAKLASLKRLVEGENKHEFRDPKYSKEREEATERVHDAMAQALKSKAAEEPTPSTRGTKRRNDNEPKVQPSKKGLWLGVDLSDSDVDSSDDDEETPKKAVSKER